MDDIRLACIHCDCADMDGIPDLSLPNATGWRDVVEVNVAAHTSEWWTHLGYCPECVAELNKINPNNFPAKQGAN